MAFRTFTDASGREWEVYTVVPPHDERRHTDRRSGPHDVVDDRRGDDDRRITVGRVSRVIVAQPQGWLVFQSEKERRRLSPIPEDWSRCTDAELEGYLNAAKPVPQIPGLDSAVPDRKR